MNTRNRYEFLLDNADLNVSGAVATVDEAYRLHYHLMPQANWMNDPNGLVFFNGYYHVFYQHHPYSPEWGPMHWGHARTKNFIHWEHLPIALAPSEHYDEGGCFSGSAVVEDGVLHLFYTGHRIVDGKAIQVQCRASSADGINFAKDPKNPLISHFPPEGSEDFRDPKVWRHGDSWYMVLASGKDGIGKVLLYKSKDLTEWEYVGVLMESDGAQGTIWECPDLFQLDKKHVLVVSPIGREPRRVLYFVGEMDYNSGRFTAEYSQELDHGPDFYAAQSFFGTERRILLAWMDAWDVEIPSKKHNWAGALSLPRELILDQNGQLRSQPLLEFEELRKETFFATDLLFNSTEKDFPSFDLGEAGLEIGLEIDLVESTAAQFGMAFSDAEHHSSFSLGLKAREQTLYLDTSQAGAGTQGVFSAEFVPQGEKLELRIFLDRSSIEVFVDQGVATFTARMYPKSHKLMPTLFALDGELKVTGVKFWGLHKRDESIKELLGAE